MEDRGLTESLWTSLLKDLLPWNAWSSPVSPPACIHHRIVTAVANRVYTWVVYSWRCTMMMLQNARGRWAASVHRGGTVVCLGDNDRVGQFLILGARIFLASLADVRENDLQFVGKWFHWWDKNIRGQSAWNLQRCECNDFYLSPRIHRDGKKMFETSVRLSKFNYKY